MNQPEIIGDKLPEADTRRLRERIIRREVLPFLRQPFAKYPQLRSAALFVAQYWSDNALDEVHPLLRFSVLETPDLESAINLEYWANDPVNLPELSPHEEIDEGEKEFGGFRWDSMGMAIPAFAAFCREGADQEMEYREAFSPYAIFRKSGDDIATEIVGQKFRPWLDGILPQWFESHPLSKRARRKVLRNWFEGD